MADEPRRSGRATKGQHTKMETPEPPTSETKKPKPKGKPSKKSAEPEPEEEQEDGDELIRCVCGHQSDEGGRMMVCCDNCNAWQHNDCMGVTEVQAELPDNYLCEQCDPDAHRPLLEAMARGERPWEDIALKKQAKKKGGKKAKAGRQSFKSEALDGETETPRSSVGTESNKRKHDSDDTASHPAKTRKSDSSAKAAGKPAAVSEPMALVHSIAELSPDARKNVAASLRKKLQPLIQDADAKGRWKIPRGRSVDSESERFAILIEYSLFMNHCGEKPDFGGQYKQQLLRILPNIEKNPTLLPQLLNGKLTADALATMTSDQMASEEHRQKMQEMKEEVEKQSILLQDHDGPRMRRTHKGDEIIDDVSNEFTSESIMSAPVVRRRESELDVQSPTDHNGNGSPTQSPAHGRRESSSFNMGNVYSHSPTGSQPPRSTSNAQAKPPPQFHEDPNIDNLLGDDGRDDAEYEPTDLQPTVWRGNIVMASHGLAFTLSSRLVAGSDLARRIEQGSIASLSELFPQNLTISGRIESKRADEYLASLSQSPSTDVSVFVLNPSEPDDPPFEHFFRYFHGKDRFAVVDHNTTRHEVRDFYLAPLEAGSQTPQFLGRLHYNDLPPNRPRKLLLAIIVCKWPMTVDGVQGTSSTLAQPGMSPAAPQLQANTPTQNGPGIAGSSAYQPPPPQQHLSYQQQQQYNMPMHQVPGIPGNPYLPPHQQPQAQYQQHGQYPAYPVPGSKEALALEILGPLANVPVAQQILQQENIQAESLHNLRRIFEKHPETQNDMARFTEVLTSTAL